MDDCESAVLGPRQRGAGLIEGCVAGPTKMIVQMRFYAKTICLSMTNNVLVLNRNDTQSFKSQQRCKVKEESSSNCRMDPELAVWIRPSASQGLDAAIHSSLDT